MSDYHRWLMFVFVLTSGNLLGQAPEPPVPYPIPSNEPSGEPKLLPPVVIKHEPTIEEVIKFSAEDIVHKKVEGVWGIWSGVTLLKEMPSEKWAKETAELMRSYGMNQRIRIPGSVPPFELWLKDEEALRPNSLRRVVLHVNPESLNLLNVGDMWCINDGLRIYYNFGKDKAAAMRAMELWKKYRFNQIGIQGVPNPVLLFPMFDALTEENFQKQKKAGRVVKFAVDELAILNHAMKTGLVLPSIGYVGPKTSIDTSNCEGVFNKDFYEVVAGDHKIARVPSDRHAKDNAQFFQNSRANEVVQIGKSQHVIYLRDGLPLRGYTAGVNSVTFLYDRLKAVEISKVWYVCEDQRPIVPCESQEDAQLLAAVLKHYKIDSMTTMGDPKRGGRYLFLRR